MPAEEAKGFAEDLIVITDQFKVDFQARNDEFTAKLEVLGQEFVDEAHDFAADQTNLAVKLTTDVKASYDKWYPAGAPDVGGEGEPEPPTDEPHAEHPIVIPEV